MLGQKLHEAVGAVRRERQALRASRAENGLRRALAERGQTALGLEGTALALADLEHRLAEQIARLDEADAGAYGHLEAHQQWLEYLAERVEQVAARVNRHDDRMIRDEEQRPQREWIAQRTARTSDVVATTAWVEALPPSPTLVSVIVPTRGRVDLLREAIASVLAQTHERFELVIVDDVSGPQTAELLATLDDPRIRTVRREGEPGAAKARNAGLDAATGEYVAYLDDDNLIGRSWLRALIWAFESHPEADIGYGALVTDMEWRNDELPWLMLEHWNRRLLPFHNPIDQNTLTHRTGVPGARFNEDTRSAGDWEFALRMTRDKDPVRIPVVAAAYRTKVEGRISDKSGTRLEWARLQQQFLRETPLRVLGVRVADAAGARSPDRLLGELERLGATTAWCAVPSSAGTAEADYDDLERAIDEVLPDVLVVPAGAVSVRRLERLQVPFVVLDEPGGEKLPVPHGSFYVGSWSAAAPFGTPEGGEPLRDALLRHLDRVRSRRSGFPDPGLAEEPEDERQAAVEAVTREIAPG